MIFASQKSLQEKEELRSITTIDEIKLSLSDDLNRLLEVYSVDLPTWEQLQYVVQNKAWDNRIILTKDEMNDEIQGKAIKL